MCSPVGMLVSVRSVKEAEAALSGGASIIDIKDPSRGSLGRADLTEIEAIQQMIADRVPVSSALGEWKEWSEELLPSIRSLGLSFVKWGFAGTPEAPRKFPAGFEEARRLLEPRTRVVLTAYADWERANSPAPSTIVAWAIESQFSVVLIDTWRKDGMHLLDWLPKEILHSMITELHKANVRVALAGSLTCELIKELKPLAPDWFAVRTAACRNAERNNEIDSALVRGIVDLLNEERAG
jgi:hypothetical protein